jgi:thiol-disulfide isomerase/thioredoxin
MQVGNFLASLKKNGVTILLGSLVLVLIVSPDAKSWLLQQLVSVGLFKAEIEKDGVENLPENASFSFSDASGRLTTTADLKGKVIFINFWASWCPPCRAEMPSLNELYKKLKDDDRFVFLFMNEDDDKRKAVEYLKKNGFTIPLCNSAGEVPFEIFGGTLPTTIVLDKDGRIVMNHTGMAGYNTDGFMKQLKELL